MTSACIFKDALRNHTQALLKVRDSITEICLHLINSNCTLDFLPFIDAEQRRGNIKQKPAFWKWTCTIIDTDHSINLHQLKSVVSSTKIIFQKLYNFYDGTQFITEFDWLWCFLRGTIVQWPERTQTQYADCSQFHRDIRRRFPRNDLYIINCIAWTTDCDHRWRLKWAHDALWFWTTAPDRPPQPKRFESAA